MERPKTRQVTTEGIPSGNEMLCKGGEWQKVWVVQNLYQSFLSRRVRAVRYRSLRWLDDQKPRRMFIDFFSKILNESQTEVLIFAFPIPNIQRKTYMYVTYSHLSNFSFCCSEKNLTARKSWNFELGNIKMFLGAFS